MSRLQLLSRSGPGSAFGRIRSFARAHRWTTRFTQFSLLLFADVQLLGAASGAFGPRDGTEVVLVLFYTVAGLLTIDALFARDTE